MQLRLLGVVISLTLVLSQLVGCGSSTDGAGKKVGPTGAAILTEANTVTIANRFTELGLTWFAVYVHMGVRKAPAQGPILADWATIPPARVAAPLATQIVEGSCGGTATHTSTQNDDMHTDSYVTAYDDYCEEDDGGINSDARVVLDGYRKVESLHEQSGADCTITATYTYDLTRKSGGNIIATTYGTVQQIEGLTDWDAEQRQGVTTSLGETINLILVSPYYDFEVKYSDYKTSYGIADGDMTSVAINGRVSYSDYGYLDVSTNVPIDFDRMAGELILKGAEGTALKITQTPTNVWTAFRERGDDNPAEFDDAAYPVEKAWEYM